MESVQKGFGADTRFLTQEGSLVIERFADVEPIIDHVQKLRQEGSGKSSSGEMYHVGDLPLIIAEKYCNEVGITFEEFMCNPEHITRIMNNPDYSRFRVWEGRV